MAGSVNAKGWLVLVILFLARSAMAFQFQTVGSVGPFLIDALSIDYASLGILIGLYLLPGVPLALLSGVLGQRYEGRRVVLTGLGLMAFGGGIMGLGTTFHVAMAGRLVSGTGAVLLNVMLAKLVADWFSDRRIATAMAILVASWPFGIALGLVAGNAIALKFGWVAVMRLSTGFSLAAFVLIFIVYRDPPNVVANVASRFNFRLSGRELWMVSLAGLIWAAYNAGYIVLISFAPAFFASCGYSLQQSSWIVSLLGWILIPTIALGGVLADRLGQPHLFIAGGLVCAAAGIAALPYVDAPVTTFVAAAFAVGLPAGAIMTLPVKILRPESRAAGMGLYFTLFYAGMTLLPSLAGKARDTGNVTAPILVSALMMVTALLFLAIFQATGRWGLDSFRASLARRELDEPAH